MSMSQCVPSWDFTNSDVPSMGYQIAELTWENGQLAMHGLRPPPRLSDKPPSAAGTLESLVNQATAPPPPPTGDHLTPWFHHRRAAAADALVPTACKTNTSVTESTATCGGDRHQLATAFDAVGGGGLTSTSLWSPENTSSGKDHTKTTSGDDHDDSVSHTKLQIRNEEKDVEVGKKKSMKSTSGKSSVSTKRRRAAAIHNQSERKRRDKINQRMRTLQKLVPNSSKTDKASILDEVIEYLKQLQAQVHTMNRFNIPQMMLPLALQHQHLQMSMMAAAAAAAAAAQQPHHMPMPVMDFNSLNRANAMATPFMPMHGSCNMQGNRPVMPHDIMSAFLAGQSTQSQLQPQAMTMDAYSRLAAFYQQFQQGPGSGSKN